MTLSGHNADGFGLVDSIEGVALRDIDRDGWNDLTVVVHFYTGAGGGEGNSGDLWFGTPTGFVRRPEVSDVLAVSGESTSIPGVRLAVRRMLGVE
jgi:hypothetical protein